MVLGLLVAWNLVALLRIVAYPVDASVGEGVIQYEAMRLAGVPIYKAVDQAPYWISTYPPLFQAVASLVGGGATLWWPRSVSLASSLWCAAALWLMVGRVSASRAAGLVAAAVWLLSPKLDAWGALARVDMLGRALETAAVFLAWRWRRDNRALAAAAVFATLAMATKQTMVTGGATVALMLWFSGERRRAAVFAGAWTGATALVYASLNLATAGWFWDNVFARTARAYDPRILVEWVTAFLLTHAGALVAVAAGFAWVIASRRAPIARDHRREPAAAPVEWAADWSVFGWAMVAAVPSMMLAGNDGVDINYFIDGAWALAGLAGIGFAAALRAPFWMPAAVAAVALILNAAVTAPMPSPTSAQAARSRQIVDTLRRAGKPVMTEFIGYGLAAGSEPPYLPYLYAKLEERGEWNPAPLVERIRRREFGAVLVTEMARARWGKALIAALMQNYEPAGDFPDTFIVDGDNTQILLVPAAAKPAAPSPPQAAK